MEEEMSIWPWKKCKCQTERVPQSKNSIIDVYIDSEFYQSAVGMLQEHYLPPLQFDIFYDKANNRIILCGKGWKIIDVVRYLQGCSFNSVDRNGIQHCWGLKLKMRYDIIRDSDDWANPNTVQRNNTHTTHISADTRLLSAPIFSKDQIFTGSVSAYDLSDPTTMENEKSSVKTFYETKASVWTPKPIMNKETPSDNSDKLREAK